MSDEIYLYRFICVKDTIIFDQLFVKLQRVGPLEVVFAPSIEEAKDIIYNDICVNTNNEIYKNYIHHNLELIISKVELGETQGFCWKDI